jgi:hypothetical protein
MFMNKKVGMIFFAIVLITIAGCQPTETSTAGQVVGAYANCYGDDTKMVSASFDDFAPLSSESSPYQPGENIDVSVILTSFFSDDIAAGKAKVRLTGDAAVDSIFTGAKTESADTLYEIDTETCLTEETEVEIGPIIYQGDITTQVQKDITGLYCYEQDVIVKGYLYYTTNVNNIGKNLPVGSNPPSSLQITKIEQNPVDVDGDGESADLRFKIYLQNVGGGTIVPSLEECFKYRENSFREEFKLTIEEPFAYNVECPSEIKLSRDEKTDVVSCKVTDIDTTNLGSNPSEITIRLSGFAYEDTIPSTTIYIEP